MDNTGLTGPPAVLELGPDPDTRSAWLAALKQYREVLAVLVRKDFQTRYKRATFGLAWAVVVPLLQATISAFVFSRVIKTGGGHTFAVYIMSGVVPFSYFTSVLPAEVTSVVDGSGLTDKVWFPRALLVAVPCLSNIVGLVITLLVLLAVMPSFGVTPNLQTLLFVPGVVLLIMFSLGLGLVLSAMHVYFRDVKFLVQAALLVLIYITPVLYPKHLLGNFGAWLDLNPLTGIVTIFHMATVGSGGPWARPVFISCIATLALVLTGAEVHRHHDRLFVDQL